MRKVIITLHMELLSRILPPHFFDVIEYIEGKAVLKFDLERGIKIAVLDFKIKDGFTLKDLEVPDEWKILDVLREANNVYTCLFKAEYTKPFKIREFLDDNDFIRVLQLFKSDIIIDLPFILSEDKVVLTFVADAEDARRLLKDISLIGDIESVSFQPATFTEYNILSCLTERQKEIITVAKKSGYYDVPRKVSTEELSRELGVSTATILEHLRKAENRIISNILAGY